MQFHALALERRMMMRATDSISRYRRVLVTGGSGFVGRFFTAALRQRLTDDSRIFVGRSQLGAMDGDSVALDLTCDASVSAAVENIRPDLVVHLAGQSSVVAASEASAIAWQANFSGSLALAVAVARYCPDATLFFASSAEVYGRAFLQGAVSETTPPQPQSVYAQSKLAAELMFASVLRQTNKLIVVRPCNHTGPSQSNQFALASFADQIAQAEKAQSSAEIHVGNLQSRRDFLDVRDVVEGYLGLITAVDRIGPRSIYNIASGHSHLMRDLLDILCAFSAVEMVVVIDPERFRAVDIPVATIDTARIRSVGWIPRIPISQTLVDLLNSFRFRQNEVEPNG